MIADAMRASVLEAEGYRVRIFEYVSTNVTPKNIMICAMKTGSLTKARVTNAQNDYSRLSRLFKVENILLEYLKHDDASI